MAVPEEAVPDEAARRAYAEFQKLYPQRTARWDDLAEWERERWRLVVGAAAPVIAAAERKRRKQLLLGCIDCGYIHEPASWTSAAGRPPATYGHPWRPRYLAAGGADGNGHVARLLEMQLP